MTECGRIENVDATVFLPERICNKARSHSKWGLKYYLDHPLGNDLLEKLASKYDPSGKLLLFELKHEMVKQKINPKFLTVNNIRQLFQAIQRPDLHKYSMPLALTCQPRLFMRTAVVEVLSWSSILLRWSCKKLFTSSLSFPVNFTNSCFMGLAWASCGFWINSLSLLATAFLSLWKFSSFPCISCKKSGSLVTVIAL